MVKRRDFRDGIRLNKGKIMTIENSNAINEAHIRELIENNAKAIRAKDIDGATSNYAPEVLLFDLINPLRSGGLEALRKRLEQWFSTFQDSLGYELRDLSIVASETVAFCHSLNHVSATRTDGVKLDMWWRATLCFRKIDGKWMVTHGHSSVPFDMESGLASLDLKP